MQQPPECLDYLARPSLAAQRRPRSVTYGTNEKGAAEAAPLNGADRAIRAG